MLGIFLDRFINYAKLNWIPILLMLLSFYDLRIDIRLLMDFFTFSSFIYILSDHPLAVAVLLTIPSLFKKSQI